MAELRLGTRGSRLALIQAEMVRAQLAERDIASEIVVIKTSGDGGERDKMGAFVSELQHALLEGTVDIAVHCLKDLPTQEVEGLELAAYLPRDDPRDALLTLEPTTLEELSNCAIVGTGSIRRTAQIRVVRPDLDFRPLVGNVDRRIERLQSGEYDAIILAMAGLSRMGLLQDPGLKIASLDLVPAPGQGTLVIQTALGMGGLVAELNDLVTQHQSIAERAALNRIGAGCSVPFGALATVMGDRLSLHAIVTKPDGTVTLHAAAEGSREDGERLGIEAAETLISKGALDLIGEKP